MDNSEALEISRSAILRRVRAASSCRRFSSAILAADAVTEADDTTDPFPAALTTDPLGGRDRIVIGTGPEFPWSCIDDKVWDGCCGMGEGGVVGLSTVRCPLRCPGAVVHEVVDDVDEEIEVDSSPTAVAAPELLEDPIPNPAPESDDMDETIEGPDEEGIEDRDEASTLMDAPAAIRIGLALLEGVEFVEVAMEGELLLFRGGAVVVRVRPRGVFAPEPAGDAPESASARPFDERLIPPLTPACPPENSWISSTESSETVPSSDEDATDPLGRRCTPPIGSRPPTPRCSLPGPGLGPPRGWFPFLMDAIVVVELEERTLTGREE